jgi:Methyltransferase FkbM domain
MSRVDYMTIDTEGSELDIILDFPWNDFDVRVVQIEQLVAARYPAQRGKKERIIQHLTSSEFGYQLLGVYNVKDMDTDDLILTRHIDEYLRMTDYMRGQNPSKMRQEGE